MRNKNKLNRFEEYLVYGLNGAKSILESDKCCISKIIISDNFDLEKFTHKNLLNQKYANKLSRLTAVRFKWHHPQMKAHFSKYTSPKT